MIQNSEKSNAMLIHLSAFAKYIVPLGSILLPLILWQTTKKDSEYVNHHGKEAVNFNISFLLYNLITVFILLGSVFGTIFNATQMEQHMNETDFAGVLFGTGGFIIAIIVLSTISIVKLILIIMASVKANEGNLYKYPLTIRFIK